MRPGRAAEELERAKTYLTGAYPLRFDGNERIANILVGMQMEGLSPDYVNTRNDQIMSIFGSANYQKIEERLDRSRRGMEGRGGFRGNRGP